MIEFNYLDDIGNFRIKNFVNSLTKENCQPRNQKHYNHTLPKFKIEHVHFKQFRKAQYTQNIKEKSKSDGDKKPVATMRDK